MLGKEKCRILKQIRAQIAAENDIDLVVEECTHKGSCKGTCPRCESEVRYLEAELEKRRRLSKGIALAGISAGLSLALTGCSVVDTVLDIVRGPAAPYGRTGGNNPELHQLVGLVPCDTEIETGAVGTYELEGDVPMMPEEGWVSEYPPEGAEEARDGE